MQTSYNGPFILKKKQDHFLGSTPLGLKFLKELDTCLHLGFSEETK